jgi:hypothetical protein
MPFLTRNALSLIRNTLFLTRNVLFLTKNMPFLTRNVLFLTKNMPFLTRNVLFLIKNMLSLIRNMSFPTGNVLFFIREAVPKLEFWNNFLLQKNFDFYAAWHSASKTLATPGRTPGARRLKLSCARVATGVRRPAKN